MEAIKPLFDYKQLRKLTFVYVRGKTLELRSTFPLPLKTLDI